ncbi:MAG: glycosyltransferase [Lachnospiraceae bacterium]|nr:glycosyltransferase [Lachnospiraceae bacterium]
MGNISKTIRYLKRNGIGDTLYAIMERLLPQRGVPFDTQVCETVDEVVSGEPVLFSILVPVFETREPFLRAMIESCLNQTYRRFELILADASKSSAPGEVISSYKDDRIRYIRLTENLGISENSNKALEVATGDYCVLLDHDDLLTEDALKANALRICKAQKEGRQALFLYSDEDKCDEAGTGFFMPHYKEKFNLDLLISNNYICHLAVMSTELLKKLKFRPGFDGAQDHDLFLRAAGRILYKNGCYDKEREGDIIHIDRILYHWRSYGESTAFDPASKEYAYNAGLKAAEEFSKEHFGDCEAGHLKHRGFYEVNVKGDIFKQRPELAACGGMTLRGSRVVTGLLRDNGFDPYAGMNHRFSGYMHKADLKQEVFALDIRALKAAPEFEEKLRELKEEYKNEVKDKHLKHREADLKAANLGLEFGRYAESHGKLILFDPALNVRL